MRARARPDQDPRGGFGSSRDHEQDQRHRADPQGPPPPPPPHPLLCLGATRSLDAAMNTRRVSPVASGNERHGLRWRRR